MLTDTGDVWIDLAALATVIVCFASVVCMISGSCARADRQRAYRDALRRRDMREVHRLMGSNDD